MKIFKRNGTLFSKSILRTPSPLFLWVSRFVGSRFNCNFLALFHAAFSRFIARLLRQEFLLWSQTFLRTPVCQCKRNFKLWLSSVKSKKLSSSLVIGWTISSWKEFILHWQIVVRKGSYAQCRSSQLKTTSDRSNHIATFFLLKVLSCKTKTLKQTCKRITDFTNKILLKKSKISFCCGRSKRFERSWRSRRSRRSGGRLDSGGFGDSVVLKGKVSLILLTIMIRKRLDKYLTKS